MAYLLAPICDGRADWSHAATVTLLQQLDPVAIGLVAKEARQRAELAEKEKQIAILRRQKQVAEQGLDTAAQALRRLQELFLQNRLKAHMFDDAIKAVYGDKARARLTT